MSCPSTIDGVANDSATMESIYSCGVTDTTGPGAGGKICLVELNSLETMVSQVKEVKPMEKALQLKKEKNQKNMISQGNFCAHCKPFSNEAKSVFRQ